MSEISSIALSGIRRATESITENAGKISIGDDVGNPEPIVKIIQSEIAFKANVSVLKVDQQLSDYILDLFA